VEQVFVHLGYTNEDAANAADVLMWASLRGVDTHGVRNLKPYYFDRTLEGMLKPKAQVHIEQETPVTASIDGNSGLGLVGAHRAMTLAIEKALTLGVGIVCARNTHHLGPAGYYAAMAVENGLLGMCATGHFFGQGHHIGVAPPGTFMPMFSTNPLSFAAPCGRHAPFVLDMSTAVSTVNRIEMYAQHGQRIPHGWACDSHGIPTTDPSNACALTPLGGTPELGSYKGAGMGLMVSILSGVLSGSWSLIDSASIQGEHAAASVNTYDQKTMGHIFAALRIDLFQPVDCFRSAMDAMIDALHAAPPAVPGSNVFYPGQVEAATAVERAKSGVPTDDRLFGEILTMAERFELNMPSLAKSG
jgi:LDH2 family malate/lactate/ureidoglycolate dehydrogenase